MPTVVMCADGWSGPPLDLAEAEVLMVDELCRAPRRIALPDDEDMEVVVALHRDQTNLGEVQAALRRLGFDPLAVSIVDLDAVGYQGELERVLTAALARARVYPGARPEQVKLLAADRRTRRGFLSLGAPAYTGAPRIAIEACAASHGCRICVANCPVGALSWSGGVVSYDPNTCIACGICVTACPRGAVENPVATPAAMAAEISTAIAISVGGVGIRYRCREAIVPGEAGWHQVEVPCTGMLTVGWILAPLALGASALDAVPCGQGGCSHGNDHRLAAILDDAATILKTVGTDFDAPIELEPAVAFGVEELFGSGSTARVLEVLLSSPAASPLQAADVGTVAIDPEACTACLMCAQVCPSDALMGHEDQEGVRLEFDPRLCVACGQCVTQCPEVDRGAITLTRGFDLEEWSRGRREVRRDSTPRCETCGAAVAPTSMLARISSLLGDDHAATREMIGRLCVDCRGR